LHTSWKILWQLAKNQMKLFLKPSYCVKIFLEIKFDSLIFHDYLTLSIKILKKNQVLSKFQRNWWWKKKLCWEIFFIANDYARAEACCRDLQAASKSHHLDEPLCIFWLSSRLLQPSYYVSSLRKLRHTCLNVKCPWNNWQELFLKWKMCISKLPQFLEKYHFTPIFEALFDELRGFGEVHRNVTMRNIHQLETFIFYSEGFVEGLINILKWKG